MLSLRTQAKSDQAQHYSLQCPILQLALGAATADTSQFAAAIWAITPTALTAYLEMLCTDVADIWDNCHRSNVPFQHFQE